MPKEYGISLHTHFSSSNSFFFFFRFAIRLITSLLQYALLGQ